jgi:alpha-glucosidase
MLDSRRRTALHGWIAVLFALVSTSVMSRPVLFGETSAEISANETSFRFDRVTSFSHLPDGLDVWDGGAHMQVTVLRDDVVRIRVSRSGKFGEDASWAVLPESRASRASAVGADAKGKIGFATKTLRFSIDRATGASMISDVDGNLLQQDVGPIEFVGNSFRVFKTMPLDEHYFGLGDKPGPLDRREQAFTMWNTDAYSFQESTDPIYKTIPYFMTFRAGHALGVFLDNTWRSSFDFGKQIPNVLSFGAVDGPLDYYVFYGPTPKRVVETYTWLTGRTPLPPMWALGYQQSRYSYVPQSRVMEIADRLRADHIPADTIYLDIEFQQHNRPFTIDREKFPDFPGMIAQLAAKNFHTVAITDLHIARVPDGSYKPYASGLAQDRFVKNPDGSVYYGAVWPGLCAFPDFTQSETREWWGTLYHDFSAMGVAGFWNDMNEPSIFNTPTHTMPEDVIHRIDEPGFAKRTARHAEIHNIYGTENSRATFEGIKKLDPSHRPFVLTRASFAGGQRYAATWTGDNSSTWNHLRLTTPMLENLGLSGFALSGADVGGFAGTPQRDLLTKWFEIGAFQPIDRDHTEKWTGDQEPWVGGPDAEEIRRRFIEERYRLMPYLYTVAEESSRTGVPIERPLFLEFPEAATDRHPIDVDLTAAGEFLLGPDLLIAPPPFPDKLDNYVVEFPTAEWYDYWTGQRVPKPAPADPEPNAPVSPLDLIPLTAWIHPELATLPVYVRGGAILPVAPLVQSTNETPEGPLTLRVYARLNGAGNVGNECRGSLYLDDGKSYAYLKGESLRMDFSCDATPDTLRVSIGKHQGTYAPWWKQIRIEIFGWSAKKGRVSLNGTPLAVPVVTDRRLSATVPDNGKGAIVEFE